MVDALVAKADEGRGRLRKASGSRQQAMIRRCPNGATHPDENREVPAQAGKVSRGTETSKYPEEKKSQRFR